MSNYVSPMEAIVAHELAVGHRHQITQAEADAVMALNQQLNDGASASTIYDSPDITPAIVNIQMAYRTAEAARVRPTLSRVLPTLSPVLPTLSSEGSWIQSAGKVMMFGFGGIIVVELLIKLF